MFGQLLISIPYHHPARIKKIDKIFWDELD